MKSMCKTVQMHTSNTYLQPAVSDRGRYFIAARAISAGTVIHKEEPVSAVAFTTSTLCDHCLKPSTDFRCLCPQCGVVPYCSQRCLDAAAQAYHAGECRAICHARAAMQNDDHIMPFEDVPHRLALRTLIQLSQRQRLGEPQTSCIPPEGGSRTSFLEQLGLCAPLPEEASPQHKSALKMAEALHEASTQIQLDVTVEEVLRLLFCIRCNSHSLYASEEGEEDGAAGAGIYVKGAQFNHSCAPNAEFYNTGSTLHAQPFLPASVAELMCGAQLALTGTALPSGKCGGVHVRRPQLALTGTALPSGKCGGVDVRRPACADRHSPSFRRVWRS
ncbi:hypothetical protein CYMTET_31123 [Cymbomonas tetramitiformis]|uniref:MYND-type domain-containing protein n=1 Tax=Cymbomonas tetramitiformis TaxID=36881 RepID=A0AAE0FHF8_9CHLO|nr:hypothetical protein CYMTET_31123 [Cymbomonas tetramitiformis]